MDKKVFRDINYGMYIVSTKDDKKVGCVINTLTQITSDNPTISISLNKENYTNEVIRKMKKFSVSILSEETSPNTIAKFGFSSSEDVDKYADVPYEEVEDNVVVTDNICGYLICEVINIIDVGTHDVFIARVIDAKKVSDLPPMTYSYYHKVIKGTSPRKAPTYVLEDVESDEEVWVCDVCGYVHKGPISDDFICPICGVNRSHFQKK